MPVKRVFSAGGIVIRKSTKSTKGTGSTKGIEVLVTQHSSHKGWDFPKGHLELGETSEQAALREVKEETGVKGEVIEKIGQTQYFYWENGEKIFKTVTFFLMRYVGEGKATTVEEVSGIVWLKPEDVEKKLTFDDTKKLWERAKTRIKNLEYRIKN